MVDLYRHRATSGERNFIERSKTPIFMEAVFAIDIYNVRRAPILVNSSCCRRSDARSYLE